MWPAVRFPVFLNDPTLADLQAGRLNFLLRLERALAEVGIGTHFRRLESYRLHHALRPALHHMTRPPSPFGMVFRKVYLAPFWRIERREARWDWPVARAAFDASSVDGEEARTWADGWRNRVYIPRFGALTRAGFLFVPLQGRLSVRRSFQSATPLAMLETLARQMPGRRIVAALHPREHYPAAERAALGGLVARWPQISLAEGPPEPLLAASDGVVTQNSALAFHGLFLGKPVLLFARIDFHHACASVPRDGEAAAFAAFGAEPRPDHDRYLWWFLQERAINAGRPEAEARIREALRAGGLRLPRA